MDECFQYAFSAVQAKVEDSPWECYDMEADRTEMHNLIEKYPSIAGEMASS